MNAIMGKRGSGKTTALIKLSSKHQLYILVLNRERQKELFQQAHELGYQIPYPITLDDFLRDKLRGSHISEILIDDVDDILKYIFNTVKINTVSLRNPDLIHRLPPDPQESEDAISRKKAIDTIYRKCSGENLNIDFAKVLLLQREIEDLPPVTPKQKTEVENRIARERYEDLTGYFCGDKTILESREEFQKWLSRIKWHVKKADELARKLNKQAEPCEDAISRRDVIKMIENAQIISDGEYRGYCTEDINIDTLPPVTPKQKTGEWNVLGRDDPSDVKLYRCSECHMKITLNFNYCPNCGAKMEYTE